MININHIPIFEKKTFLTWQKGLVLLVLYCLVRKYFGFFFQKSLYEIGYSVNEVQVPVFNPLY